MQIWNQIQGCEEWFVVVVLLQPSGDARRAPPRCIPSANCTLVTNEGRRHHRDVAFLGLVLACGVSVVRGLEGEKSTVSFLPALDIMQSRLVVHRWLDILFRNQTLLALVVWGHGHRLHWQVTDWWLQVAIYHGLPCPGQLWGNAVIVMVWAAVVSSWHRSYTLCSVMSYICHVVLDVCTHSSFRRSIASGDHPFLLPLHCPPSLSPSPPPLLVSSIMRIWIEGVVCR